MRAAAWTSVKWRLWTMPKRGTHFQTLGISEGCTTEEVKAAFRKKAMEYHPDRLQGSSVRDINHAHEQFVKIRLAYEVLVDPQKRLSYVEELKVVKTHSTYSTGYYQGRATSYTATGATDFSKYRRAQQQRDANADDEYSTLEDRESFMRSRKTFEQSWKEAVHAAMYGDLDPAAFQQDLLPEHIETEELKRLKTEKSDQVISHIVYGRNLLGKIIYESEKRPNDDDEMESPSELETDQETLSLYFRDRLWARCQRSKRPTSDPNGKDGEKDTVFRFDSRVDNYGNVLESLRPFGRAVLFPPSFFHKSRDGFLYNQDNDIIYRLRTFKKPGVDNFHIFHAEEKYLEFLCTRAWLPSSSLWLFPPRDEQYDAGGWYIQHNKFGQHSRFRRKSTPEGISIPMLLDPAIPLLLCSFNSLDRMKSK